MSQASWNDLKKKKKELREIKARIKEKCWDCMGRNNIISVECGMQEVCPLYPLRPKHITNYKSKYIEEN